MKKSNGILFFTILTINIALWCKPLPSQEIFSYIKKHILAHNIDGTLTKLHPEGYREYINYWTKYIDQYPDLSRGNKWELKRKFNELKADIDKQRQIVERKKKIKSGMAKKPTKPPKPPRKIESTLVPYEKQVMLLEALSSIEYKIQSDMKKIVRMPKPLFNHYWEKTIERIDTYPNLSKEEKEQLKELIKNKKSEIKRRYIHFQKTAPLNSEEFRSIQNSIDNQILALHEQQEQNPAISQYINVQLNKLEKEIHPELMYRHRLREMVNIDKIITKEITFLAKLHPEAELNPEEFAIKEKWISGNKKNLNSLSIHRTPPTIIIPDNIFSTIGIQIEPNEYRLITDLTKNFTADQIRSADFFNMSLRSALSYKEMFKNEIYEEKYNAEQERKLGRITAKTLDKLATLSAALKHINDYIYQIKTGVHHEVGHYIMGQSYIVNLALQENKLKEDLKKEGLSKNEIQQEVELAADTFVARNLPYLLGRIKKTENYILSYKIRHGVKTYRKKQLFVTLPDIEEIPSTHPAGKVRLEEYQLMLKLLRDFFGLKTKTEATKFSFEELQKFPLPKTNISFPQIRETYFLFKKDRTYLEAPPLQLISLLKKAQQNKTLHAQIIALTITSDKNKSKQGTINNLFSLFRFLQNQKLIEKINDLGIFIPVTDKELTKLNLAQFTNLNSLTLNINSITPLLPTLAQLKGLTSITIYSKTITPQEQEKTEQMLPHIKIEFIKLP